ncbi:MAG: hypothetical protein ACK515_13900 [bacterium]
MIRLDPLIALIRHMARLLPPASTEGAARLLLVLNHVWQPARLGAYAKARRALLSTSSGTSSGFGKIDRNPWASAIPVDTVLRVERCKRRPSILRSMPACSLRSRTRRAVARGPAALLDLRCARRPVGRQIGTAE